MKFMQMQRIRKWLKKYVVKHKKYIPIFPTFENWEIFIYRKQNKNKNLNITR